MKQFASMYTVAQVHACWHFGTKQTLLSLLHECEYDLLPTKQVFGCEVGMCSEPSGLGSAAKPHLQAELLQAKSSGDREALEGGKKKLLPCLECLCCTSAPTAGMQHALNARAASDVVEISLKLHLLLTLRWLILLKP